MPGKAYVGRVGGLAVTVGVGAADPLNLPGYPFTFFVYKQIAADNAAIVTEAFLESWTG